MYAPRTGRLCAITVTLVTALASAAHGFDFSPVSDFPQPAEERTRVDVFLGLSLGYDSNPSRATSSNEEGDGVAELLAGISLARGNTRLKYSLGAEGRMRRHGELDQFDYDEGILKGGVSWATRKLRFAFTGRYAMLADPVEVETLYFDVLKRTESSYVPEAGFTFGKMGLGVGYRARSLDFEDESLSHLDHEDSVLELEFRFGRPQKGQYFLHLDSGAVDYEVFDPYRPRYDFDYRRLYIGWRSTTARESAIELGVGSTKIESDDFQGGDGLYFTGLMTRMLQEGSSALEVGFTHGTEAAATADFKTASRALLRYSKRVNMRSRWSLGYRLESSEFTDPDATTADSLSVHVVDFGFAHTLGSAEGRHGRLYAGVGYESGDDFDRLRVFVGIALAY